jgi:hypothetical protein
VVAAGVKLLPGLDPDSLFLDDQWVGIALREAGLGERIGLHLPAPLGFLALEGLPGRVVHDPELALQVLPVLAYLAAVALFPVVIHRLTGNGWAAALGTAMLASAPLTAAFAVRAKHYTLDLFVTAAVLLLMVELFRSPSSRRFLWTGGAVLVGVMFSFASVFLAVTALGTGCAAVWVSHRDDPVERRRVAVATGAALVAIGAFFVLVVRKASRPIMVEYWADYFPSFDGWSGVWTFLSQRVSSFLSFAMPDWGWVFLLFMPLGFVWLWRSGQRGYCVALLFFYVSVVAAAVLHAYPMGTGRTDIFSLAVTTLLACLGVMAVLDRVGSSFVRQAVYVGLTSLFAASTLLFPGARYPSTDDKSAVDWVLERIEPNDALVLSPYAAFAFEFYGEGPSHLVPADFYGHGFDVVSERPRTFTSAVGRWDLVGPDAVEAELGRLTDFVDAGPERLVYLETYGVPDGRASILNAIASRGYRLVDRTDFGQVAEAFLFEPVDGGA